MMPTRETDAGRHPLMDVVRRNKRGERAGAFSICSAHPLVLRAAMLYAKDHDCVMVFEATSNQVNQFGGYTGMTPEQYAGLVRRIAAETGLPEERLLLGGDHLGPLVWQDLPESAAMKNAGDMIRAYTLAGFTKIHIDTSMRLGDDDPDRPLPTEVSAARGAALAKIVYQAFAERQKLCPDALRPVLVIGSEVPVPGGSTEHEDTVTPTSAAEFRAQAACFQTAFESAGLSFSDVAAFVVQPGVEFGDDFVFQYDRDAARPLMEALKEYNGFVFEGHSTDYQTRDRLARMVEDGVAFLKVGPALTFALREALLSLEEIEAEQADEPAARSGFRRTLTATMDEDDRYWKNYYTGTPEAIAFKKIYSFSDRCRYYLPKPVVERAIDVLLKNLDRALAPAYISRHFPDLFEDCQRGLLATDAMSVICGHIGRVLDRYAYSCGALQGRL